MFDRPHSIGVALLIALATVAPQSASAQSSQISSYVGTYEATRLGAEGAQSLTLVLAPHGIARLRTEFPGYARTAVDATVDPRIEDGSWAIGGPYAIVHLTRTTQSIAGKPPRPRREDVALTFSLRRCTLTLKLDPTNQFGTDGLKMKKRGC